ncbi:MAG: DUF6273 domain-containing protein [Coriobacteriaceae bacterium]|nr:DUF6273 domain-containing protein [Coriobacteriaceae bacterium]
MEAGMYCRKCGWQLEGDAVFCSRCGTPIQQVPPAAVPMVPVPAAQPQPHPTAGQLVAGQPVAQPQQHPVAAPQQQQPSPEDAATARRRNSVIGVLAAAAIVVAAVVLLVTLIPRDPLKGVEVGDVVSFGEVAFTDYGGGEFSKDLKWRVLAVEDGRALVIAEDVVDFRPYHEKFEGISWEGCDLREWLNDGFYAGLPETLRERTVTTRVNNDANPQSNITDGNYTEDRVFLLSVDEAERYFASKKDRRISIDLNSETIENLKNKYNLDIEAIIREAGGFPWWLRSPGLFDFNAAHVFGGDISPNGFLASVRFGVRPALWVDMGS